MSTNKELQRRILGPISSQMGGSSVPSSGGGGGSLTIQNNVAGAMLMATGQANKISGVTELSWDSATSTLSSSANIYVSGSTNYLYLQGTDSEGNPTQFKVAIEGQILKIVDFDS